MRVRLSRTMAMSFCATVPLSFSLTVRLRPVLNFSASFSKSMLLRSIQCSSPRARRSRG